MESHERRRLTNRQQQILTWILTFREERGYPPTIREIAAAFGVVSPNGIVCHLRALERKGYLKPREFGVARAIVPV